MAPGESATTIVRARLRWNDTGIVLSAGETYRFAATGCWIDWFIRHGPGGDPSTIAYLRCLEPLRVMPHAHWFALIGALDRDMRTAFVIGEGDVWRPESSGELTCFANDVPGFFWNNWGDVRLDVSRID
jgi:hypothetical protein